MSGDDEIIISSENVHKTYLLGVEGVAALRGVSVDVKRGELLVIYGTSGGGKSTLLNVLGTIDTPTKGNLSLFDARITDRTPDTVLAGLRNKKVGFVFQSFNLLSTMTAMDNVKLPMIIDGQRSAAEIDDRARALLKQVGLGHRLEHYPSMLSGGEQQRVTIARALANEPEVLLLDEPTGDLDTMNTHRVIDILMRLNREHGLTMAMVTHDVYMKQYASRVLYLRDGKVARIEEIDATVRDKALVDLTTQLEEDRIAQEVNQGGQRQVEVIATTRAQNFYAKYSTRACGTAFREHPNPALFAKLFPRRDGQHDADGGTEMQPATA